VDKFNHAIDAVRYWEIGQLKGLIFTNWETADLFPTGCKWIGYGMDFGFTNDPTVIVKVPPKHIFLPRNIKSYCMISPTGLISVC